VGRKKGPGKDLLPITRRGEVNARSVLRHTPRRERKRRQTRRKISDGRNPEGRRKLSFRVKKTRALDIKKKRREAEGKPDQWHLCWLKSEEQRHPSKGRKNTTREGGTSLDEEGVLVGTSKGEGREDNVERKGKGASKLATPEKQGEKRGFLKD